MRKTVFVLNRAAHDYSEAERFGELVYCTEGSLNKLDIQQMYRELEQWMGNSNEDDYILLTSLTSLCSIACSMFALQHDRLNLLIHTNDGYVERSIYF